MNFRLTNVRTMFLSALYVLTSDFKWLYFPNFLDKFNYFLLMNVIMTPCAQGPKYSATQFLGDHMKHIEALCTDNGFLHPFFISLTRTRDERPQINFHSLRQAYENSDETIYFGFAVNRTL